MTRFPLQNGLDFLASDLERIAMELSDELEETTTTGMEDTTETADTIGTQADTSIDDAMTAYSVAQSVQSSVDFIRACGFSSDCSGSRPLTSYRRVFADALIDRIEDKTRESWRASWEIYMDRLVDHGSQRRGMGNGKTYWENAMATGYIFRHVMACAGPKAMAKALVVSKTTYSLDDPTLWEFFAKGLYQENTLILHRDEDIDARPVGCIPWGFGYRRRSSAKSSPQRRLSPYLTHKRLVLDRNKQNVWRTVRMLSQWRRRSDVGTVAADNQAHRTWGAVVAVSIDGGTWEMCVHIQAEYDEAMERKPQFLKNSGLMKYTYTEDPYSLEQRWTCSVAPSEVIVTRRENREFNAIVKFPLYGFSPIYRRRHNDLLTEELDPNNFWEADSNYCFCYGAQMPEIYTASSQTGQSYALASHQPPPSLQPAGSLWPRSQPVRQSMSG
eukprot:GEMP01012130.1.p1 GENE.GEMP01012130.1~~GEMP01012130.1.p1  ORF type:complete len:443 (+),score=73.04 GEMP01012130.1:124-1452(+)